ncbi:HAD family hydrolase [Amphibacillus cookii]|uniref:HAD family hydrolase n=1 Tax=Amphibacillus cookii TaxID=767787 RepID=UPI0019595555|nr:HAD family hydrolase [Amphibacillus cookii]MBM7541050.1 putative hydrolase of the HAD superfamily [Amphibacillus cookii]
MKTLIFDVDDTLYDQLLPFEKAVNETLHINLDKPFIHELYLASRKYSDQIFEQEQRGEWSTLDLQIYRIQQACLDFDIQITTEQAISFQQNYLKYQRQITLFPEIKQLLDQLSHQNVQLGVLTNGNADHQTMKIEQLNLKQWISPKHFFISGAIGIAKPNPDVFNYVECHLTSKPSECWYIGDSYPNDVHGAKRAGWHVAWFNHRNRQVPNSTLTPTVTFNDPKSVYDFFSKKA